MDRIVSAAVLADDGAVTVYPALFYGLVGSASGSGQTVTVYDGRQSDDVQEVLTVTSDSDGIIQCLLVNPVVLTRGLYVRMDAGVTKVSVFWCPA